MGGSEEDKTRRVWAQDEGISKYRSPEFQPKMEGIAYLLAEWISVKEMKALQSACMLVSIKARAKEFEEFLSDLDNQVWKDMSEEWQRYLVGKRRKPSHVSQDVPNRTTKHRGKLPG